MATRSSFQLPDFLKLVHGVDLRMNRNCHSVSSASEGCFAGVQTLSENERSYVPRMRIGMWAAACLPTCDQRQLRIATDALTALILCKTRLRSALNLRQCGWAGNTDEYDEIDDNELLGPFLGPIVESLPTECSKDRLKLSLKAFRRAQNEIMEHRANHTLPTAEEYIRLCSDSSGIGILFSLVEMAEGLKLPWESRPWDTLIAHANLALSLSLDILSYNNDQFVGNPFNVVSILCTEKSFSVQGAVNHTFGIIKESMEAFDVDATHLCPAPPASVSVATLLWNIFTRQEVKPEVVLSPDELHFLQGIRDVVTGTLHWAYETDLYFGDKGDEIRQFGWVFIRRGESEA